MKKAMVKVRGMACSMCEAHVQQALRNEIEGLRQLKASHRKAEVTFLCESRVAEDKIKKVITALGYDYVSTEWTEENKKGMFGFWG